MTKFVWKNLTIDQKIEHIAEVHTVGDSARMLAVKLSGLFTTPINRNMVTSIYNNRREMRELFPLGGTRISKTRITKPKATKPKATKRKVSKPKITKRKVSKPKVVKPKAVDREVVEPKMSVLPEKQTGNAPVVPRRRWENDLEDSVILERIAYDKKALKVELLDMNSTMCHFVVNDGGPFLYCGHEVAAGKEYCQHHYDRMFYKFKPESKDNQPNTGMTNIFPDRY